jgi:hypothetical protein
MNFGEMRAAVRTRIAEASANFWSDSDIDSSINEGFQELADATEWYERSTSIPTMSNRTYLDLRGVVDGSFISPKRARNLQTGKWLTPTTVRNQDSQYRQWERNVTEPSSMFMRGLWWIGLHPKPSSDNGFVRLYYSAIPAVITDDSTTIPIPEEFHMALVSYALYDLLAQDAETGKAMLYWNEYVGYESNFREFVKGRTVTDRVGRFGV